MRFKIKAKIEETKLRSLLKTCTARIFEVIVDTILFHCFIGEIHISLGLAIAVEVLCSLVNFINERLWNLTDFGRKIKNGICQKCGAELGNKESKC